MRSRTSLHWLLALRWPGYGDNAKAALITRGNAELSRLGIAMGCKAETFAGLSGMGDLIVTCTSMHSRNLHAGMLIGRGKSVEEAKTEVGQVVEGINALPAACRLAKQYKVEMPIVQAVEAILDGKLEARSALMALMAAASSANKEHRHGTNQGRIF